MRRTLVVLIASVAPLGPASADSTISALSAASALTGTELLYGVQSAADRKITAAQIQTFVQSGTIPVYQAGNWYMGLGVVGTTGGTALGITNQTFLVPFIVPKAITISQLAAKITTVGTTNTQFGIYNSSPTTGLPTTNIDHTGDIVDTSLGLVSGALGSNRSLTPGLYWFGVQTNDTAAAFAAVSPGGTMTIPEYIGSSTLTNLSGGAAANMAASFAYVQTYGTWGDLSATSPIYHNNDSKNAIPFFLVNSVP